MTHQSENSHLLQQVMKTGNQVKIEAPVEKYIKKISSDLEASSVSGTKTVTTGRLKPGYESAHAIPNQSLIHKIINLNFAGTLNDFQNGVGTSCDVEVSVDHSSDAKLLLLESKLVAFQNNSKIPVGILLPDQSTNTEFLSSKISSSFGSSRADIKNNVNEVNPSFVIPANTHTTVSVNLPIYDRKQEVDFEDLQGWINFKFDNLASDILHHSPNDGITIVRHSQEKPSPIVTLLESSAESGDYDPGHMEECEHDGRAGCLLSSASVAWSLEHIQDAYNNTAFASFTNMSASIKPMNATRSWNAQISKSIGKIGKNLSEATTGSAVKLNDLMTQNQEITIGALIQNTYVVCNANIEALEEAINQVHA